MTAKDSSRPSPPALARLHLTEEELGIVLALLAKHLPGSEVWAFGSRVSGRNLKPFSDLDLAIVGAERMATADLERLSHAFGESDLPFRVDLVELIDVDAAFRRNIENEHVQLTGGR